MSKRGTPAHDSSPPETGQFDLQELDHLGRLGRRQVMCFSGIGPSILGEQEGGEVVLDVAEVILFHLLHYSHT